MKAITVSPADCVPGATRSKSMSRKTTTQCGEADCRSVRRVREASMRLNAEFAAIERDPR